MSSVARSIRQRLTGFGQRWQSFWFQPQQMYTLGVVRMAFGALAVLWGLWLLPMRYGLMDANGVTLPPRYPGEVAERYRYRDESGEIGVIASVTRPFCGACTRARLSADGSLYTCLFATTGHDLRALVRGDAGDDEIAAALGGIWRDRADRYSELRSSATPDLPKVEMSYIGG